MERVARRAAPWDERSPGKTAVFSAGRTIPPLQSVAHEIARAGGAAEIALDALDEPTVWDSSKRLPIRAGRVDTSFNAIAVDHIQGVPLACLWIIDPVAGRAATHLFGAFRGAADEAHGRGVILNITADAARLAFLKVESFSIASRWVGA